MLTLTDLFCGAGGSSSGAVQVPGVAVAMAANHWQLAVDTHQHNHPHAAHDCADISQTDPRRYRRTDLLWASPECTNHSQAQGRRRADAQPDLFGQVLPSAAAQRSRATMWDVIRFAEHHRYRAVVVENVIEVLDWVCWPAWTAALGNLGYRHQLVMLNSMHAQAAGPAAPQSRDRLYVVGWRAGDTAPDLRRWTRPLTWCHRCDQQVRPVQAWKRPDRPRGRYRAQYRWACPTPACRGAEVVPDVLPAAVAIDWTLPAARIGERDKPLSAKTLDRIRAGLARYGASIAVPAGGTWNQQAQPVNQPFRTRTTRDTDALVVPVESRDKLRARPSGEPLRAQTARRQDALVVPLRRNGVARPADTHPLATVAAAGNHHALIMRNNTARGDQGQMCTPTTQPVRTILASQVQSVVGHDALIYSYDTDRLRTVDRPMPTQTTITGDGLLNPAPHAVIDVDDATFRMLEPHEIQAAMAFDPEYQVLGNKRERVRQLGNAVTPPAARDLIAALVEAITGQPIERTHQP